MEKKQEEATPVEKEFQSRNALNQVIIDTPALLNMIKHCQDSKEMTKLSSNQIINLQHQSASNDGIAQGARGVVRGVLKKEIDDVYNLMATSTEPLISKQSLQDLKHSSPNDLSSNEIGFYVSCQLGLAFSHKNLVQMIISYRSFRNSIMVVYDVSKSAYGLNPIQCFRFSPMAIKALNLNDPANLTDHLVQDKIREYSLEYQSFFEEINVKIHRSHLLQAFLFDHIQPHMPVYNKNVLKLGTQTTHMTQLLFQSSEQSNIILDELRNIEIQHKNQIKHAKKANKKIQAQILANKDKTAKGSTGAVQDQKALESFKVEDATYNKMDLFLFSKQVDQLCSSIGEFEQCFPEKSRLENVATA